MITSHWVGDSFVNSSGYSPLIETLDLEWAEDGESLTMHGRSTSTAGRLVEGDDGEARKHGESLGGGRIRD